MSDNMRDVFTASDFDDVDIVLDTDRRFDEALVAADNGDEDLVDTIMKEMDETGVTNTAIEEDDIMQYNPEDDDAVGIMDTTAEDIREYVSEDDYGDDDGELIDAVMDNEEYED